MSKASAEGATPIPAWPSAQHEAVRRPEEIQLLEPANLRIINPMSFCSSFRVESWNSVTPEGRPEPEPQMQTPCGEQGLKWGDPERWGIRQ